MGSLSTRIWSMFSFGGQTGRTYPRDCRLHLPTPPSLSLWMPAWSGHCIVPRSGTALNSDLWTADERQLHISMLELRAVSLTLPHLEQEVLSVTQSHRPHRVAPFGESGASAVPTVEHTSGGFVCKPPELSTPPLVLLDLSPVGGILRCLVPTMDRAIALRFFPQSCFLRRH